MNKEVHTVTGAFGYSGKYITELLLKDGYTVQTLTGSVDRENTFGRSIKVHPFNFNSPEKLNETLKGTRVLYNTYWVRFNYRRSFTHADAVRNTLTLFECARKAGVERVVHVSITNPTQDTDLEYFRGKAELEQALAESGMSYSILRPAVLFGREDILINNIAWFLRKFPVFGVFGDGSYQIQPIYVGDLARLAVDHGKNRGNEIIQAVGPETFTFREMVETIGQTIGKKRRIINIPPILGLLVAKVVGLLVGDVVLTHDEIIGLMEDKLHVDAPPAGWTRLTDWAMENAESLGRHYTSEMARRRDRVKQYVSN